MKRISDKEYNEYMTLLEQRRNGEILTFDGLELIIKANNFDKFSIKIKAKNISLFFTYSPQIFDKIGDKG